MKLLMIDSDVALGEQLAGFFARHNMRLVWVPDVGEGAHHLDVYGADLLLLDFQSLPPEGPGETFSTLRRHASALPLIVLGAQVDIQQQIHCLDCGADDFLPKPFEALELLARAKTLIRRTHGHSLASVGVGSLRVDLNQHLAFLGNFELPLTRMEYELLEFMALRSELLLSRETLLNHLYGGLEEPDSKIIDVFVCKIRRKMNKLYPSDAHIETVWGRGYKLTRAARELHASPQQK